MSKYAGEYMSESRVTKTVCLLYISQASKLNCVIDERKNANGQSLSSLDKRVETRGYYAAR
jgi:hypothetical protein